MKKSNLFVGILYVLIGCLCLLAALLTDTRLDPILFGMAGAGLLPGVQLIGRYVYWSSPDNAPRYRRRMEQEQIELHDELKEKLRDKSGRWAYVLGLCTVSLSMVVFSILGLLGVVEQPRVILLYLGAYLVFQVVAGNVIFKRLLRRY